MKLNFRVPIKIFAGLITFTAIFAQAEPWLSNRFAQNCAGCHSPSRRNLPTAERRCTLSCQGCHVNPSGGGIRNSYGYWNQQRWARSLKSDLFTNKGRPAPMKVQEYGSQPDVPSGAWLKKQAQLAKNGSRLVVTDELDYNEKHYDKSDRQEHITVQSRDEFLARVTQDDPYRIERTQNIFAGGDFRYFYLDIDSDNAGTKTARDYSLPMGLDLGVRIRPIKEHVQLVFEQRYLNGPSPSVSHSRGDWAVTNQSQVRSSYVLIDDLPYATYAQGGIYRPMFGSGTPDHTSLANSLIWSNGSSSDSLARTAGSSRYVNRVFSIGGSPNVPFANLHLIKPIANPAYPQDDGFAANIGGRFVTLGLSFTASYWKTKYSTATHHDLNKEMMNLNAGGIYKNIIVNWDSTIIDRDFAPGAKDKGQVDTIEVKYRIWREMYALLNFGNANTSPALKAGKSSEVMYGLKTFLWPGSELELMYVSRKDKSAALGVMNTDLLQAQMHLFF
jgi:hypothetical protein